MLSASAYSSQIKSEADELLRHTNLSQLLSEFGEVNLGGSYSYDLMIDRDLDFGVVAAEITPEVRAIIVSVFAQQKWVYGLQMSDRVNFKPLSNLEAPLGLFVGLTIPFPDKRWNIDIWFEIGQQSNQNITELINGASDEQRAAILQIKYELAQQGKAIKGVTSAKVYVAVLRHGILTTEQFAAKYL